MEKVAAQVPRPGPFGLPVTISVSEYRTGLNPVCHLSQYSYKVNAMIGATREKQQQVLTVLDTGAGPNLIKASILPGGVLSSIDRDQEIVRLSSASNHPLDTVGIVTLTVIVGCKTCRQQFGRRPRLGADAILGCQYIDHEVKSLRVKKRICITQQ